MGLICAVRDFETSRNTPFQTYATIKIRGAMLDELRKLDWIPRSMREKYKHLTKTIAQLEVSLGRDPSDEEIQKAMGMTVEEYDLFLQDARPLSFIRIEDVGGIPQEMGQSLSIHSSARFLDSLTLVKMKEQKEVLARAIESLPEKEKRVIALYYYEELNLKEIGQVLGITESRVCQLHTQAIVRLKAKLHVREL
jgi:RNA polymerase sigma factor for flagellar operon FliA